MFAKIFTQILDSSLAEDYQIRLVFEDFLKLCDSDGIVDMTHEAIARRTNVPLEIVRRAISELEKPDPRSRKPDHGGRRIMRLDEHRDWGWVIVNYLKYREIRTQADKAEAHGYGSSRSGYVYYVADDGDQPKEIKVAFSTNPWARLPELRSNHPTARILAIEKTSRSDLSVRHEQFQRFQGENGWFRFEDELKRHIESLAPEPGRSGGRSDARSNARSYDSDRSSMQRQRNKEERENELAEIPPMNRKDFDALAQMRGIPKDCAEWFWNTHDARNWLDATGQPILKVEPLLLNALASWRSRHRPHAVRQSTSSPPGKISGAELILRQKEYERVIEAIARIRRNAATDAMGTTMYSEKEKRELAELRARREELKQLLNLKI